MVMKQAQPPIEIEEERPKRTSATGFGDDKHVSLEELLQQTAASAASFHNFATSLTNAEPRVTTLARKLKRRLARF